MIEKFNAYIKQHRLLHEGDKILLAVSGGVDSVVMAHLFHSAKIKFGIAHCNFQLRGKESGEDERFVKKLSAAYKADVYSKKFKTKKYAGEKGISVQMAARELRYEYFEETRSKYNYDYIAVAHHADDSAETVLLNLIRGTGIAGYHGILPKNKKVIRPLLFASRQEILNYAKKNKIKWREDASNQSDHYLRNKIRLKIIPLLKQINPSILQSFSNHISQMSEVETLYREYIHHLKKELLVKKGNEIHISIPEMVKHASVSTLLFELLSDFGFNSETAAEISESLDSQPGKIFFSSTHQLVKDRQQLLLSEKSLKDDNVYRIQPDAHVFEWKHSKLSIRKITLTSDLREKILSGEIKDKDIAYLDADLIKFPLTVRKWQKGDYFCPLGMKNKKLLSDYFIDNKFSVNKKENTWLLFSENCVCWVIGERTDDRYKIRNQSNACMQLMLEKE